MAAPKKTVKAKATRTAPRTKAKSRSKAKNEEKQLVTYLTVTFTALSILFVIVAYVYYG